MAVDVSVPTQETLSGIVTQEQIAQVSNMRQSINRLQSSTTLFVFTAIMSTNRVVLSVNMKTRLSTFTLNEFTP